jgi:hypothetical protein
MLHHSRSRGQQLTSNGHQIATERCGCSWGEGGTSPSPTFQIITKKDWSRKIRASCHVDSMKFCHYTRWCDDRTGNASLVVARKIWIESDYCITKCVDEAAMHDLARCWVACMDNIFLACTNHSRFIYEDAITRLG